MTARLIEAGAAKRVRDADDLAVAVGALLADPAARDRMATCGRRAGQAEGAVLTRVQQALAPLLDAKLGPIAPPEPSHACA